MYAHECKIFTFNILPTKSKLETKKSLSGSIFEGNLHILLSQIDLAGAWQVECSRLEKNGHYSSTSWSTKQSD